MVAAARRGMSERERRGEESGANVPTAAAAELSGSGTFTLAV